MIFYSHIFVQSAFSFYAEMQTHVYDKCGLRFPAEQQAISDLQACYFMGGEL